MDWVHKLDSLITWPEFSFLRLMNLKSVIDLQLILKILYWGARLNFMFSLPQLHTKSLCVLALQNSQFGASTSSRPQTVNFEALGHKAILGRPLCRSTISAYTHKYWLACIVRDPTLAWDTQNWIELSEWSFLGQKCPLYPNLTGAHL